MALEPDGQDRTKIAPRHLFGSGPGRFYALGRSSTVSANHRHFLSLAVRSFVCVTVGAGTSEVQNEEPLIDRPRGGCARYYRQRHGAYEQRL